MSRVNAVTFYIDTISEISVNQVRLISINLKITFDTNITNTAYSLLSTVR